MEPLSIAAFIIVTALILVIIYLLTKRPEDTSSGELLMMQNQIQELSRLLDQKMDGTTKAISESQQNINKTVQNQFSESIKMIANVTEKLVKLDETNKQVVGFTEQLENLQQTLQNPKHRGILGEYFLENVLKNVLPPGSYEMQYKFKDGDIVDAVVFVKDKIIPVDSKFSLENYNRAATEKDPALREEYETSLKSDLKKRIDETSKYIKPKEGTMDFAFMFIPAEGVYYDLLINQSGPLKTNTHALIEYAFKEKHVIIVSPTSFLAYLQTVMQGLRALQIEESAKEIRERVEDLGKHLLAYDEYLKKVGKNLETTVNSYNASYKEFNKIDKDVVKITGGTKMIETMQIDKPILNETK